MSKRILQTAVTSSLVAQRHTAANLFIFTPLHDMTLTKVPALFGWISSLLSVRTR